MSRRQHFDSGHGKPEHTFRVVPRPSEYNPDDLSADYSMVMDTPDHPEVASVSFDVFDHPPTVSVGLLQSYQQGRGHARKLMQNLYDTFPEHAVDWGATTHPAATHLASQFAEKYKDRTSYFPDDEGYDPEDDKHIEWY